MEVIRHSEEVMGTVVSFDVRPGRCRGPAARRGIRRACATLHRADAVFSIWKLESPLSRLRRGEISVGDGPRELAEVLGRCGSAREASGGWFDPWSIPGGVDPTGLVKGWAAQKALDDLVEAGIEAAMVNAGGDIAVTGGPEPGRPWRIGIRDPFERGGILCTVETFGAVATSGTYERGAHVLDPRTQRAATGAVSATVVGPDLALADALATGLVAAGEPGMEAVVRLPGYSAMIVGDDGHPVSTDGFPLADDLLVAV
jgi:thiamine biosynthesis lipoprotein